MRRRPCCRDQGEWRYTSFLAKKGVRVHFLPPDVLVDALRRFDCHNQQLLIADTLDHAARQFLATSRDRTCAETGKFHHTDGRDVGMTRLGRLCRCGAPHAVRSLDSDRGGTQVRYRRQLGCSGQVSHRLTTMQWPGRNGIPFFFLRLDEAGNVSKRLNSAGFPFPAHGGGCPQ